MARNKVVLKLGNDISTDIIYPGRYMATVLPTETPQFAIADNAAFNAASDGPPGRYRCGRADPVHKAVAGRTQGVTRTSTR
jgi:hypothetical protein